MRKTIFIIISSLLLFNCTDQKIRVLVFTKANGFIHESRIAGAEAIKKLEKEFQFIVTKSEDSLLFRKNELDKFDVIVFLSTSGNILDEEGKYSFVEFIRNGGGFVGIHGATTTEYDWVWFNKLIGAHFDKHPKIQRAVMNILNPNTLSTQHLPNQWVWTDEWYNWRNELSPEIEVLITVDETTYEGGKHEKFHPICWRHKFEGGRSWYTAIGHSAESYNDNDFLKHIAGGIMWASGKYD